MLHWQVVSRAKYQKEKTKKRRLNGGLFFLHQVLLKNSSHVDNWEALSFLLNQEGSAFGQVKTG